MSKKNEKKLCWNCDGSVGLHLEKCPYCGVDPSIQPQDKPSFSFQSSSTSTENTSYLGHPFQRSNSEENSIPKSPYGGLKDLSVSDEEWNKAMESEEAASEEEDAIPSQKNEMIAFLLLLPGVVFFLFGLVLLLFSDNGILTFEWNQSFAYFYFLGALPLLILGWRSLR